MWNKCLNYLLLMLLLTIPLGAVSVFSTAWFASILGAGWILGLANIALWVWLTNLAYKRTFGKKDDEKKESTDDRNEDW